MTSQRTILVEEAAPVFRKNQFLLDPFLIELTLFGERPFRVQIRLAGTEPGRSGPSEETLPPAVACLIEGAFGGALAYCGPLPPGLSDFALSVLEETRRIPFGETITYGELAKRIGRPRAARAVGGALGRNPLPLLIPCHRVVGLGGALTGYSEGVGIKEALLAWEKALIAP